MAASFGRSLGSVASSGPNPVVLTTTATASVGERIVVGISCLTAQTFTVTDSAGNTYTSELAGTDGLGMHVHSAPVTTQLTSGGTISALGSVDETWVGVAAAALVDVGTLESSNAVRDDFGDVYATSATALAGSAGVLVGFSADRNGSAAAHTAGTNLTEFADFRSGNINMAAQYRDLSAPGSYNSSGGFASTGGFAGRYAHVIYQAGGAQARPFVNVSIA
jgi:hypothetical protein